MNNKETLNSRKSKRAIELLIKGLLSLLLFFKYRNEELLKLKNQVSKLDNENPEYNEILSDKRENAKMVFRFMMLILSFFIDFFLMNTALEILCDQNGLPNSIKYIAPIFFILIELLISYFFLIQDREGKRLTFFDRLLPYLILPILAAFSLLAITYVAQSYNVEIDGASFLAFISFTIIIQTLLLITSALFHFWLIRNAEEITEAIVYLRYKVERNSLINKSERIEKENKKKHYPYFTELTHECVKELDRYKQQYPNAGADFVKTMPEDLINAINRVMGKTIVSKEN